MTYLVIVKGKIVGLILISPEAQHPANVASLIMFDLYEDATLGLIVGGQNGELTATNLEGIEIHDARDR